ncbi:phospho-2-dehydro-3-deoxyheptonate aldolase [Desulfosarcina ovata subsp. sediminis]|uniref:Phospho-2-dehydro-3-deoxyheptonate aldolase n=1 Tax=Desulfosarcina ovata subsp. sediminis TaxID=885957 RepID=A0A5K8A266_9BACT|nr:3-deoxy-7-phosphoheptulonate synthase [Desulfosarcina ovata]BBO86360.1 phospho-2-dehydro-3-deoxyheptonate aldolase [Desulfosarcina ovata subsp. sediminis]
MKKTYDLNVLKRTSIITPDQLREEFPMTEKATRTVLDSRQEIKAILDGNEQRLLIITGPCSIISHRQAVKYGELLAGLQEKVKPTIKLVMRVYFEKPRTNVGFKGLISDPHIDKQTFDIDEGLRKARKILMDLNEMGVACGTEILSQTAAERLSGLIAWACIGARTTESQNHREWASAFSMPVGFKNGTDGNLNTAINALLAASTPQVFIGNDPFGVTSRVFSSGNKYCHIVLRGGKRPNYDPVSISEACEMLANHPSLMQSVIVDCSHKNSGKDYRKQGEVFNHVLIQRIGHTNGIHIKPNKAICGMMLESNIEAGKQAFVYGETKKEDLNPFISITDACIGWEETEEIILTAHRQLK